LYRSRQFCTRRCGFTKAKQASASIHLVTRLDPKITVGDPTTSEQLTDLHMTDPSPSPGRHRQVSKQRRSTQAQERVRGEEEDHTGVLAAVGRPLHHG
jgi:hypothetical protein